MKKTIKKILERIQKNIYPDNLSEYSRLFLRNQLDAIYIGMDILMKSESDFCEMICQTLKQQVLVLELCLKDMCREFSTALPLPYEFPSQIEWQTDINLLKTYNLELKSRFPTEVKEVRSFSLISNFLEESLKGLEQLKVLMIPKDEPMCFIRYAEMLMKCFSVDVEEVAQKKLLLHLKSTRPEYMRNKLREHLESICTLTEGEAVDVEKRVLYKESLGRYLWMTGQCEDATSEQWEEYQEKLLYHLKLAEFYGNELHQQVIFQNQRISPEEANLDAQALLRQQNLEEFRQQDLQNVVFYLNLDLGRYFGEKLSKRWLENFLWKAANDEKVGALTLRKFSGASKMKSCCQLTGELLRMKQFLPDATSERLCEALLNIATFSPDVSVAKRRETLKRYLRDGFKGADAPLHHFLEKEIKA